MTVAKRIETHVTARTRSFERGMRNAQGSLSRFVGGVRTLSKRLVQFGAVSVAAAAAATAYMVREQMKQIDATAKLADRLNATTEGIVGLQHAAEIMGASQEDLNKGLEMFARRIGEVIDGTGEAKQQFEKLGLDANALAQMKLDEAFFKTADAISNMGSQSEKAAAAADILGRSGTKLVNLIDQGEPGLRKFREEAEALGLTFTRLDAAKVEEANDALLRARRVITGLTRRLTIELAPIIKKAATAFKDWAISGEGAGAKVVKAVENVTLGVAKFLGFIDRAKALFTELAAAALEASADMVEALRPVLEPVIKAIAWLKEIELPKDFFNVRLEETREEADRLYHIASEMAKLADKREQEVVEFFQRLRDAQPGPTAPGRKSAPEEAAEGLGKMEQAAKSGGMRIAQTFTILTDRTRDWSEAIRNLIQDLASLALRTAIIEPLGKALGGGLAGIFGGGGTTAVAGVPAETVAKGITTSGELQRTISNLGHQVTNLGQYRAAI